MRASLTTVLVFALAIGCGGKKGGDDDDDDGPDACIGIECQVVNCGAMGLPVTTLSGTVFAPNGTLPLNGVNVYVPRDPLPPFLEGVQCDRCSTTLPGAPVTQTVSGADGTFRLENVPAGADIPLVVTTGKWRRTITIPTVNQCTDNAVGASETRLPKNKGEGDMPKIALTTGSADSLECLIRKLGIDLAEITDENGTGRINYFAGNGVDKISGNGIGSAQNFWQGGGSPNTQQALTNLSKYDIVFFSCEGNQRSATKPQQAFDALEQYTAVGGRVFASHWHNIWVGGVFQGGNAGNQAVANWRTIATWTDNDGNPGSPIFIDEVSNPKGPLFADWMVNVGGSATRGEIIQTGGTERRTALTLDTARAERWVQTMTADANPAAGGPQMFQFTTPVDAALDQRCGKVVFTDMHVSGNGDAGGDFPGSCGNNLDLSAQEKALAFMFFDIAGCVGGIF